MPAILEKAAEFRQEVKENPEKKYNKEVIFAKHMDGSEDDYIVNLSLNLMEACC